MNLERARIVIAALPHVVETVQWGDNLVFWVGDKAIGGKMFALADLDGSSGLVLSLASGHERMAEVCEVEGFRPAPYFARIGWVAAERWDVLPSREWEELFALAHGRVFASLPRKTVEALALPPKQLRALVAERRKVLAAIKAAKEQERAKARRPPTPGR